MRWINLKDQKPPKNSRVLVCDENGYVCIETTDDVMNVYTGRMTWLQSWKRGNATNLVAWMPLPAWPKKLCLEHADGAMP